MKNFIILAIVFVISGCTTVTSGWGNAHYSVVANEVQSETGVVGSVVMANSSFSSTSDVVRNSKGNAFVSSFENESTPSEKIGKAGSTFLFGFIALSNGGDITVAKAMQNGGIKKINTVETKTTYYPFVFTRTTIVTGE